MHRPFRSRKRKLPIVIRTRPTHTLPQDVELPPSDDPIHGYSWSSEFDLTKSRDKKSADMIPKMHAMPGQTFGLYRVDEKVAEFDHFPEYQEIYECVIKRFHGGVYSVRHSSKPKFTLLTYSIGYSPPPTPPTEQDKPSDSAAIDQAWAKLEQESLQALMESADPKLRDQLTRALLEKMAGVKLRQPADVPLEERVLAEAMENPEFSQRYAEHLLDEAILGQKPTEVGNKSDPLEDFMEGAEQFKKVMGNMGFEHVSNRTADTEAWALAVKEFFASGGVGQLFEGLAHMMAKKTIPTKGIAGSASVSTPAAGQSLEGGEAPRNTSVASDAQPVAPESNDSGVVTPQPLNLPDDQTVMPDKPMI